MSKKAANMVEDIPHVEAEVMEGQVSLIPSKEDKPVDMAKLSERLENATTYIRREVTTVSKSFCKIGFKLWEVREDKLFEAHGFKNVYEYGEKVLGFKKTSTGAYISVCERFSIYKNGRPSASLSPDLNGFSYGQLQLMASMPEDQIKDISPDTTCKEIRELKRVSKITDSVEDKKDSAPAVVPEINPPFEVFSRVLTKENMAMVIKLLGENIGHEITIYVEDSESSVTGGEGE